MRLAVGFRTHAPDRELKCRLLNMYCKAYADDYLLIIIYWGCVSACVSLCINGDNGGS